MWRNNPIGSLLVSCFFLLALIACWCSARHFFAVKETETIGFRYQVIQAKMTAMRTLLGQTVEYSKKNPDLDPLLYELKLKVPPSAVPAAPPPARPGR